MYSSEKRRPKLPRSSSKYSLADQMAVMSNIDLMLSMDSANGHIASLFGINVITLWGATHPYVGYAPFGQPEKNSLLPDKKLFPRTPVTIYGANCPKNYVDAINELCEKFKIIFFIFFLNFLGVNKYL